jgi:hypothetical protein
MSEKPTDTFQDRQDGAAFGNQSGAAWEKGEGQAPENQTSPEGGFQSRPDGPSFEDGLDQTFVRPPDAPGKPVDRILVVADINKLLQRYTIAMLGLENDEKKHEKVRIAYQTKGQPAPALTDESVAIYCREIDDPYNRTRERKFSFLGNGDLNDQWSYIRAWSVLWSIYGPNSFERARMIRSGLFLETNRSILKGGNLALIPDIPAPRRVPELFQGRWWERVDFSATFYELVVENLVTPYIQSTTIVVITDSDVSETIEIATT